MNIGENIKKYRKQNKMTQTELANKLNKSLRTIQKYESSDILPSIQVLNDIASALNIEPSNLIDGDMKVLAECYVSNMTNDELITYKNRRYFANELDNKIPLYDRLEPKELELVYLFEIDNLKDIIESNKRMIKQLEGLDKSKDNMIKQLEDMNKLKDNMIKQLEDSNKFKDGMIDSLKSMLKIYGGDTDGE